MLSAVVVQSDDIGRREVKIPSPSSPEEDCGDARRNKNPRKLGFKFFLKMNFYLFIFIEYN